MAEHLSNFRSLECSVGGVTEIEDLQRHKPAINHPRGFHSNLKHPLFRTPTLFSFPASSHISSGRCLPKSYQKLIIEDENKIRKRRRTEIGLIFGGKHIGPTADRINSISSHRHVRLQISLVCIYIYIMLYCPHSLGSCSYNCIINIVFCK